MEKNKGGADSSEGGEGAKLGGIENAFLESF